MRRINSKALSTTTIIAGVVMIVGAVIDFNNSNALKLAVGGIMMFILGLLIKTDKV